MNSAYATILAARLDQVTKLIWQLERAVFAQDELDAEITAVRHSLTVQPRGAEDGYRWNFYLNGEFVGTEYNYPVLMYTRSLTAAVTLLNNYPQWNLGTLTRSPGYVCRVRDVGGSHRLAPFAVTITYARMIESEIIDNQHRIALLDLD